MSHISWSSTAQIGSCAPYHQDPRPGGAPVLTPDGHWRWDVDHWELRDDPDDPDGPEGLDDPAPDGEVVDSLH